MNEASVKENSESACASNCHPGTNGSTKEAPPKKVRKQLCLVRALNTEIKSLLASTQVIRKIHVLEGYSNLFFIQYFLLLLGPSAQKDVC